jgi:hypothetical protein
MELNLYSSLVALLAAGGGGAAIAFAIFNRLGGAWLDARFESKIEAFRHERAKELERLRAEIDGALRATLRYQEKRFDACLDIWNALKLAQSKLLVSISPLQQYSDIRRMDDESRNEYLATFGFSKWQLEEILNSDNIQDGFSNIIDRQRLVEAGKAFSEFDSIVRSHELFFDSETYGIIRSTADKMHSSIVTKDIAIAEKDRQLSREAWTTYDKECIPLIHCLVAEFRRIIDVS